VDGAPSLAGLGYAITNWASGINKLTLHLVGSASNGLFRLNDVELLTATTLSEWLNICQRSNTEVCVVLDFDNAGSYLNPLGGSTGPKRLCVAGASPGERASVLNGGIVSFSTFCFDYLFSGFDLWTSFSAAREKIFQATGGRQRALLDGDRDGVYLPKKDGPNAQNWFLGSAFRTGDEAPTIDAVLPHTILRGTNCLKLWASGVATMEGVSNVICLITPPEYAGLTDLIKITLSWQADTGRYELPYCGFTNWGIYICTFLATDVKGNISAPLQSEIEVPSTDAYEIDDTAVQATIFPVGDLQRHNFHSAADEDWVAFYAQTGLIFRIEARQLGANSDLRLDLYFEQADGIVALGDYSADNYSSGSNVTEALTLDLKTQNSNLQPGVYYLRISSANTNLFGLGSEYELQIHVPFGGCGGALLLNGDGGGLFSIGCFYVYLGPPQALAAGAAWAVTNLTNQTWYSTSSLCGLPIPELGFQYTLKFRSIPGFIAPTNRPLVLSDSGPKGVQLYYVYTNLSPRAESLAIRTNGTLAFTFLASAGKQYALEESTNLIDWVSQVTNEVPADCLLRFVKTNSPAEASTFYRARYVR
jgi:hypothetical protein